MSLVDAAPQFRVELAPQKPRMIPQFNDFHQIQFRVDAAQVQPVLLQHFPILVVHFVSMPMPLGDPLSSVGAVCLCSRPYLARISPQSHGGPFAFHFPLIRHQIDYRVGGVFVEIGSVPNSEMVKNLVETNKYGEILINSKNARTSHLGIWAAGDVTDDPFKQNNISAGDGVKAALDVNNYLTLGGK